MRTSLKDRGDVRGWVFVVVVMTLLWTGLHASVSSPGKIVGSLISGFVVSLIVVFPFRRIYDGRIDFDHSVRRTPTVFVYLVVFLKDVIVANFDVAWRVLAPSMPIEPRVVVVPLRVESEYGVTTIANSITLTPGTLTMDYDEERHALYVHSIFGEDIVEPIRRWEKYAVRVFDGRSPSGGDPDGD
ncbi:MAG: Na+/H+ antiporter subunit E [Halobacteria archaeon]|nr:Na+/H+ antiporter subunit E [Halobacteria archaeon]